ncbi:MAG: hypothetical protein HYS06_12155 [Methylocystis sp.]|nr:hypothetical protein [Methylocystis sp.]MBI3274621.1 hypothetical protein [Methylocystis sp.]
MTFVQVIVTVCALAQPPACDDRRLQFFHAGSLRRRLTSAQPLLAQWIGRHPGLLVAGWRCAWPGAEGEKI